MGWRVVDKQGGSGATPAGDPTYEAQERLSKGFCLVRMGGSALWKIDHLKK